MKPKYKMNLITGGVVFVFAVIYFALSWQISDFKGLGAPPIDAKFVPRMWGILLMVLSLIVFLRGVAEYFRMRKEGNLSGKKGNLSAAIVDNREVIMTFVCLFLYILLLQPVGFIIMSSLFIFAEAMILTPKGKRNPVLAAVIAAAAAVFVDFAFVNLLHVLLPTGILGW